MLLGFFNEGDGHIWPTQPQRALERLTARLAAGKLPRRGLGAEGPPASPARETNSSSHWATSALSQLKSRIGILGRIGDSAWHKEVCHAEVVRCATGEARTSRASGRCQEAKGDRSESAAGPDSTEGGRCWSQLDRRAYRGGILVSDENCGKTSPTICRARI